MKRLAKQLVGAIGICLVSIFQIQLAQASELNPWADFNPQTGNLVSVAQVDYADSDEQPLVYQNARPQLAPSTSSMPIPHSYVAPTNLALKALGRSVLPQTRLTSFIKESGMRDDIYGHDGDVKNKVYSPIGSGFYGGTAEGLTTGHQSDAPSVYYFPTMAPLH